jgi:hypothetical protein
MNVLKIVVVVLVILCCTQQSHAAEHRIGGGLNYWKAMDDIDFDHIDDKGFSYLASYQYRPTDYFGIELDLEVLPDKYEDTAFAPQLFLLVGKGLYAGAGIGVEYCDSEFADNPFFTLRTGINFEILPHIYADVYAHYRFDNFSDFNDEATDPESDTIFIGTAIRVAL